MLSGLCDARVALLGSRGHAGLQLPTKTLREMRKGRDTKDLRKNCWSEEAFLVSEGNLPEIGAKRRIGLNLTLLYPFVDSSV